jgi:signal transduction histidine kinase
MEMPDHHFLQGFTPDARERLLAAMVRRDFVDGEYLFRQGDPADGVYLVLAGEVEIVRTAGAQEKVLDRIESNDYFGEVAVLDGLGRSTAARARGTTSVAKVPGEDLLVVLASGPGSLTLSLLKHVLTHLRKATDMVVSEVVHKEKLSLVGEMASSLMHDLRTPVSSIRLSADLINVAAANGKVPQWCDGIRLQCDRLVGMAAELMEFSKGESRLCLARTTITAFLDQFRNLNEGFLQPAGMDVIFKAEPGEMEIDVMRMQRVLQNLVTNAIEALDGTPKPRLEIRAWVKDAQFHLAVEDNGPGIPEAIQSRIFEPFVTHGKTKGIGLGMAIVRNIVTAHGGNIQFDTTPGRGTTFLVSLPQRT